MQSTTYDVCIVGGLVFLSMPDRRKQKKVQVDC